MASEFISFTFDPKHSDALPIIITHGWPGSVIEFLQVIGPLVDPTAHGGEPHDAFHVVIPSLPGFGFSDKPTEPGWRLPRIAEAWGVLMQRLGYTHYVAQGGDWGAGVTSWMAKQQLSGLTAIHLNLPILFPPPPPPPGGYSAEEQTALTQLEKYSTDGTGYASIQGTRPQTLGYGADSKSSMDLALKALNLRRPVGPDRVRVTSLGTAQTDVLFPDSYGRKWQERLWPVPFLNIYIVGLLLPTPDGYAAIILYTPSSLLRTTQHQRSSVFATRLRCSSD